MTIARAELDALRAAVADAAWGDRDEALRDRDAAHAREVAAKDRRAADLERAYHEALRDREIAAALADRPLVAGAAAQLIRLWRDDFDVVADEAGARVLARDGHDVGRAVAERLAGPEFAHFCLPASRGGTGARGADRPATSPPAAPRTLGEAALMRWRDASIAAGGPSGAGWGRRR